MLELKPALGPLALQLHTSASMSSNGFIASTIQTIPVSGTTDVRYAVTVPYGKTQYAWKDITVYVGGHDRAQKVAYSMCQRYSALRANGTQSKQLMAYLLDSINGATLHLQIGTELMAPSASCNAYDVNGYWIKLSSYEKQARVYRAEVKQISPHGPGMKYGGIQRVDLHDADPTKARKSKPQPRELPQRPMLQVSPRSSTTFERLQGWLDWTTIEIHQHTMGFSVQVQLPGPRSSLFQRETPSVFRSTTLVIPIRTDAYEKAQEYWQHRKSVGSIDHSGGTMSMGHTINKPILWIRTNWHNGDARYQLALSIGGKKGLQASKVYTPDKKTGTLRLWTRKTAQHPHGARPQNTTKGRRWWKRF